LTGHRPLQSPVLVGRDDLLALADRRLAEAAAGQGHLLFVAGEAGIGKTRLLAAVAEAARRRSFGVVRAAAFPGDVEASGGLLLDLASDLRQSGEAGLREVGQAMAGRLRELAEVGGDRHRQRRLLVQDLADEAGRIGDGGPVLVVLEDLHWADQLSLEVVAHLAARLDGRPLLVAGAYRSDGIPLHVEELLAAVEDPVAEPGPGGIPAVPVPDTLADAVLARARALDDQARQVAEAGP
jgi:predicted ATPase